MPPRIQQTVKVVVGAQPEKKKRRRRRAAPKKKVGPTYIERFIAHPGFAASQIITTPVSIKPSTFEVSALQEYQIQKQRERAGGMQTSVERMKQLTGPAFDEDVIARTPKKPKVRQPTPAQAERAQAIAAFKEAFPNTPLPEGKKGTAQKLREAIAKKQDE